VLPNGGPGLNDAPLEGGLDAPAIAAALSTGELDAVYLLGVDPLRDLPDRAAWEDALEHATTVIVHAAFLSDTIREHANVVFPSESAAEKEGTVTHPDGRIQRLRPAIARQGEVRAEWSVLSEIATRLGAGRGALSGAAASAALFDAVPFYNDLTLAELAGHGVRWPARPQAAALAPGGAKAREPRPAPAPRRGRLVLGTHRSVWAAPEVEASPALQFLRARQRVEVNPADAARLALQHGARMLVLDETGASVQAEVALRDATPAGTAFLERGLAEHGANALRGQTVTIVPVPEPEPEEEPEAEVEEALA